MNCQQDRDNNHLEEYIQEISTTVLTTAKECHGDTHRLLALLRTLEQLHRQIREELFEPSLPNTRNALANMLRDIAESGGWPYIERMKLQALLQKLVLDEKVIEKYNSSESAQE